MGEILQPGKTFVAIGECMVELAPQEGGLHAMGFAGDTFNTAWYARQLLPQDWTVEYVSAVGTDALSDRMLGFMRASGIGTRHVLRRPDRTLGLYLITLDGAERSFSYWRGESAARTLADDAGRLAGALEGVALAYVSGITLAILAPDARARLLRALAEARARGTLVALDPNLRPRLWSSVAAMCAAVSQAAALADILLPSFDDEARHFGDATPEATARRYLAAGGGVVVVKDGPAQILLARGGDRWRHRPDPVAEVVDTTAAGDSFNAGFLAAWLDGQGAEDAMRAGAALAGRVIAARGALVAVRGA